MGITLASGSSVSAWADQSGNGVNFIQNTAANQPSIVASGMNGLPHVRFNGNNAGTGDWLQASNFPTGLAAAEGFVIKQNDDDPGVIGDGNNGLWMFDATSSNSHCNFSDNLIYDAFGTTARKTTVNPAQDLRVPHVYSVRTAANAWSNWINGSQLFTTATNTVGWTATPFLGRTFQGTVCVLGNISELIVCDPLSAGDRTKMSAYLAARSGAAQA